MPKKSKPGLNDLFPVANGGAATERALETALPRLEETVFGDVGYSYGNIPTAAIVPNPFQPRRHFDQQKLQELATSLKEDGMLEPILVRHSHRDPGRYELAAGERRWRAAQLADLAECPAKILDQCSDARMRRIALLENLQREGLTPLELAETYHALMEERDEQGQKFTIRSLAAMLHKDRSHVDDHLALLRVPDDVRKLIEEDPAIPLRVIRELGSISEENDRAFLIAEVRARNLKTADLLAILQQHRNPKRSKKTPESEESEESVASSVQPSSALALAVLERKLHRYHTDVAKTVKRLSHDWPTMNNEQRKLVRQYTMTWITELQQLLEEETHHPDTKPV